MPPPWTQVLNGAIAAVLFNIIYDTILSQKLKWYALCPVIDSMNHRSSIQVRIYALNLPHFATEISSTCTKRERRCHSQLY